MRIRQCYTVLKFFKPYVMKKYGVREYVDPNTPALFWGMYIPSFRKLVTHRGFAVVVWCGTDALITLKNRSYVQFFLQNTGRIKHVAISSFLDKDLTKAGIPHITLPLLSMPMANVMCMPRGRSLYAYLGNKESADKYGAALCNEVSFKSGIPLITAYKDSYARSYLVNKIYRECFLGLRLLRHDGMSNSVIELGLAGRNVVYNGNTPNALNYRDEKDIIQLIQQEYAHRKESNTDIANSVAQFINVKNDYLNTEFWEGK